MLYTNLYVGLFYGEIQMILWDINSYSNLHIEDIYNDVLSALVKTNLSKIPAEVLRDCLLEYLSKPYLINPNEKYKASEFFSYLNMIYFDEDIEEFSELISEDEFISTISNTIKESIKKHLSLGDLEKLSHQLKDLDSNVICLIRNYSPVLCYYLAKELGLETSLVPESTLHSSVQNFIQKESFNELTVFVGNQMVEKEIYAEHSFKQDQAPVLDSLKINNLYVIEQK